MQASTSDCTAKQDERGTSATQHDSRVLSTCHADIGATSTHLHRAGSCRNAAFLPAGSRQSGEGMPNVIRKLVKQKIEPNSIKYIFIWAGMGFELANFRSRLQNLSATDLSIFYCILFLFLKIYQQPSCSNISKWTMIDSIIYSAVPVFDLWL